MNLWELLKIEFIKVKRSKIIPLIFIAPILVVSSGVANLHSYFTPEYTNAWAAMFIQSALVYAYYLLPFSMVVVCVMLAGHETGNNGILKMLALPVSRYTLSAAKFCVSRCICCCRIDCNNKCRNYRSITHHVFVEMEHRSIFYDAAEHSDYVGNYSIV